MTGTQNGRRFRHLTLAHHMNSVALHDVCHRGIQHITALTSRAGDHHGFNTLGDIASHRRGTFAGLVVGVGVNRHQTQRRAFSVLGVTHHGPSLATHPQHAS